MSQPTSNDPLAGEPLTSEALASPGPTLPSAAPKPSKKRSIDVYTVMLISSLLALGVGCLLLYLELQRFK